MSKHTPGPWMALKSTFRNSATGHEWHAYGIEQDEATYGDDAMAIIYAAKIGGLLEANARLIAAAPDLLAACEAAAALIDRLEDEWMHTTPEGQQLRAALARARGEG